MSKSMARAPACTRPAKAPDWFPSESEIKKAIAFDLMLINRGAYSKIVPGFKRLNVDGITVGEWFTQDEAFGDGCDDIAGAWFVPFSPLQKLTLFRTRELFERYQASGRRLERQVPISSPAVPVEAACEQDVAGLIYEKHIENAIVSELKAKGHIVRQQVYLPSGIADIVDDTDRIVIEVKISSKMRFVLAALDQLDRYRFDLPGYDIGVGLPDLQLPEGTLSNLRTMGIRFYVPIMDRRYA